jgi:DNA repair exonuclease SbcCD ATPase subunit
LLATKERITELEELIKTEQQIKDSLLLSKRKIDTNILKLDINTVNVKIENINNKAQLKKLELADAQAKYELVKKVNFSNDDYKALILLDKEYSIEINNIKNDIKTFRDTNKNLLESEICPTCHRKYDGIDNSKIVNENEAKINKLIENGVKAKAKLDSNKILIDKMDEEKVKFDDKLKLENLIQIIPVQIENLRNDYREQKQLIKDYNENKDAIDSNNEIDIALINVNAKLNSYSIEKDTKIKEVEYINRNIIEFTKTIEKNKIIIGELKEEFKKIRNWKIYLDMIGKNGISKMVLRKTLPIINSELSRMLDDVCDFDIEVVLTDKNDVIFKIIKDGIASNLSGASGFERTASALALRCVLGNISTMPRPNFITLDEILGKVSKDNYENIRNVYKKMEKNYQFILHISHIEDIKDWHSNIISISKISNISSIKTEIK